MGVSNLLTVLSNYLGELKLVLAIPQKLLKFTEALV